MCGLLGIVFHQYDPRYENALEDIATDLLLASEARGKDATGICQVNSGRIFNLRLSSRAKVAVKKQEYSAFFRQARDNYRTDRTIAFIGHTRLATHGIALAGSHHQPILRSPFVVAHNGVVLNEPACSIAPGPETAKQGATITDTEIVSELLAHGYRQAGDVATALDQMFTTAEGENNFLICSADHDFLCAYTSTGSLHYMTNSCGSIAVIASEKIFLANSLIGRLFPADGWSISTVPASSGAIFGLSDSTVLPFSRGAVSDRGSHSCLTRLPQGRAIVDSVIAKERARTCLHRCSKCTLPETMPFIVYDDNGVCNYCRTHVPTQPIGESALRQILDIHRSTKGEPDCIVALSGGRDSCYGLHLLRTHYKMNPIAFTYDWGVVTPLARRNQSRMCDQLGVEHIWIAADFNKKRRNICQNIKAWLKRPHLGMVPLFMAGDKEFFVHANRLRQELKIDLLVFAMNPFERTDFKSGFAGVEPYRGSGWHYRMDIRRKMRLALFYLRQMIVNPRYVNASLLDSIRGFFAYYFLKQDYLYLFDYLVWDEIKINETLIGTYGWETRPDYQSTWRIGDGTAPFYNFIYSEMAGFTENDTLRSNLIREGRITREHALSLLEHENTPRWQEIIEYCNLIGLNSNEVIQAIEGADFHYVDSHKAQLAQTR